MKKKRKFCPKCGKEVKLKDDYCISCGYSFKKRKKRFNVRNVLIAVAILVVLWIVIRLVGGNPIIPRPIIDIFTNSTRS